MPGLDEVAQAADGFGLEGLGGVGHRARTARAYRSSRISLLVTIEEKSMAPTTPVEAQE